MSCNHKKTIICIPNCQSCTSPPASLSGLQVQSRDLGLNSIIDSQQIPLDTVINNAGIPDIVFNFTTGNIKINTSGLYYIDWWANVNDILPPASELSISLSTIAGTTVPMSIGSIAPIKSVPTQISGNGIINATSTPITLQFINTTGNSIQLGNTSIQLNVSIIKVK